MNEQIRAQAAEQAAKRGYDLFAFEHNAATPYWLEQVTAVVLQAIYESEGRIAEESMVRHILCTACFARLPLPKAYRGRRCKCKCGRCGHKMRLPKSVGLN